MASANAVLKVGLDLSLSSPAVAVCAQDTPHVVSVLVLQQRKRELAPWRSPTALVGQKGQHVHVERQPYAFDDRRNRWRRIHAICTAIVRFVEAERAKLGAHTTVTAQFEGYAFDKVKNGESSSLTGLAELGGVIRHAFYERAWAFVDISPGAAKASFAKNGRASKAQMAAAYVAAGWPALEGALGTTPDLHPYEDAIDALAVLHCPPPDPNAASKAQARRAKKRKLTAALGDKIPPNRSTW